LDLDKRFAGLLHRAVSLRGTIYRSTAPKYANSADLLSGEGSRRNGARWNPIGVAAVYGSVTPQTALEESLAHANYYRLPVHSAMPRTFVAIEFNLAVVVDLTDGRNRQVLAISEQRLVNCDWRAELKHGQAPITQEVGRAASRAGLEAIRVRSAADPSGQNLVVFVDNLRPRSSLALIAPGRL